MLALLALGNIIRASNSKISHVKESFKSTPVDFDFQTLEQSVVDELGVHSKFFKRAEELLINTSNSIIDSKQRARDVVSHCVVLNDKIIPLIEHEEHGDRIKEIFSPLLKNYQERFEYFLQRFKDQYDIDDETKKEILENQENIVLKSLRLGESVSKKQVKEAIVLAEKTYAERFPKTHESEVDIISNSIQEKLKKMSELVSAKGFDRSIMRKIHNFKIKQAREKIAAIKAQLDDNDLKMFEEGVKEEVAIKVRDILHSNDYLKNFAGIHLDAISIRNLGSGNIKIILRYLEKSLEIAYEEDCSQSIDQILDCIIHLSVEKEYQERIYEKILAAIYNRINHREEPIERLSFPRIILFRMLEVGQKVDSVLGPGIIEEIKLPTVGIRLASSELKNFVVLTTEFKKEDEKRLLEFQVPDKIGKINLEKIAHRTSASKEIFARHAITIHPSNQLDPLIKDCLINT